METISLVMSVLELSNAPDIISPKFPSSGAPNTCKPLLLVAWKAFDPTDFNSVSLLNLAKAIFPLCTILFRP